MGVKGRLGFPTRVSPLDTEADRKEFWVWKKFGQMRLSGLCVLAVANEARSRDCRLTQLDDGELTALIRTAARGDREAFAELYRRTAPKLFAILLRMLRSKSMAEDALQDVFLKIWQNADSFSPEIGPAMGWLVAIARNRAIDILRTKNPAKPAETEMTDFFANIADFAGSEGQIAELAALQHCLGTLEESARNCILLAYYEGYSRDELARHFDRPVGTIKTWLHRSLAILKSCLEAAT